MRADLVNFAVIHHNDKVRLLHRYNPLGNQHRCDIRHLMGQILSDLCFGFCIDCAGRIIQYQNLRLFQQGSGDTQALFLTAGQISASLFHIRIIPVRKILDKFICMCQLARMDHFLIGRCFIPPSQVVFDGT